MVVRLLFGGAIELVCNTVERALVRLHQSSFPRLWLISRRRFMRFHVTRGQTAANKKSERNIGSVVYNLPDELLAYVFALGCPKPEARFHRTTHN